MTKVFIEPILLNNVEIVDKILKKKELRGIDKKICQRIVEKRLDKKTKELIEQKRWKNEKVKNFIKEIRAELRRIYGGFQNPKIDRDVLLKNNDYIGLLKSHLSSKERIDSYKEVCKTIESIVRTPNKIVDIGAGMNPIGIVLFGIVPKEYVAVDISSEDLSIVKQFLESKGIMCKTYARDVREEGLPNERADLYLFLKFFEIYEQGKSHRPTEELIKNAKTKWIVASFSTKTMGNMAMKRSRRIWFEVMVKRLGYWLTSFEVRNEIFYVIRKD